MSFTAAVDSTHLYWYGCGVFINMTTLVCLSIAEITARKALGWSGAGMTARPGAGAEFQEIPASWHRRERTGRRVGAVAVGQSVRYRWR